jgi:hypothetical protein
MHVVHVFYRGLGILVAPVAIVGFFIPILLEIWIKNRFGYAPPNWAVMTPSAVLPFLGMLGLDALLAKFASKKRAVDRTGAVVEIPQTHTFMFLPIKWCAYVWLGLAICLAVTTIFTG